MHPERYLRLRAEEVIAAAGRPAYEVLEDLSTLASSAWALVGAGALEPAVASVMLVEIEDALLVRGATWIDPALPALPDIEEMHALAAGDDETLLRVAAIATALDSDAGESRTLTSLEIWTDRGVVRYADDVGGPGYSTFRPGPDPGEPSLVLHVGPGRAADIDLAGSVVARDAAVRERAVLPSQYLERLAWAGAAANDDAPYVAALRTFTDLEMTGAATPLPDEIPAVAWADEQLVDVVPLALRLRHGYAASIERWTGHWRLQLPKVDATRSAVWSAVDGEGGTYGGVGPMHGAVRFRPALADSSSVTIGVIDEGVLTEFEVGW